MLRRRLFLFLVSVAGGSVFAAPEPPQSPDGSVKVSLFASEPDIVTPIGATVDAEGRLLVIESHSHFRPKDYKGPATDRIQVFEDTNHTGHADKITTRYEGQNFLMNLVAEREGSLLVSSRNEIFRLDGAGKKTTLAHLETKANYPHNGLHGLASDGHFIYVGIGENYGGPWTLVGTDGSTVSDTTGSGAIFRMDTGGQHLTRMAHGFWNPFGLGIGPLGALFAVDNDPDGRPPCRLIHVLPGGDYGFELRYGRTGLHPLQSWDGELPGTLGMIAGVGEAPCAVLWHRGVLLVSSWRDHVVQKIILTPRGGTFTTKVQTLLSGGDDFRPVGLAAAPDGSVFVNDWASNSYPVHCKGRIWKLVFHGDVQAQLAPDPARDRASSLRSSTDVTALLTALNDPDPAVAQAAQFGLSQLPASEQIPWSSLQSSPQRIGLLRALLDRHFALEGLAAQALADSDDRVRQMAVRAVAEQDLKGLRPNLEHLMTSATLSPRLLQMTAAAISQLDGDPAARINPKKINAVLIQRLNDPKATDETRAGALHMLLATHPKLDLPPFEHGSAALQLQAVRYLNDDSDPARFDTLAKFAMDGKADVLARAEAIDGLAQDAGNRVDLLLQLTTSPETALRAEALRTLRPIVAQLPASHQAIIEKATPAEKTLPPRPPPDDLPAWSKRLASLPGDPAAGYRIFFHPTGPGCYHCHTFDGRGHAIGPDLSHIYQSQSADHVLESILTPSKEIAPLFTLWTIKTRSGQTIDGMLLRRDGQATEVYVDSAGQEIRVHEPDVASRKMRSESLMPTGLIDAMSDQDLRDLIALLTRRP